MRNPGNIRIQSVQHIEPPKVQKVTTPGGVPMYYLSGGNEEVLHLELIFSAGKGHEQQKAVAHATAVLFSEGTHSHNSHQIAEEIEFYGATLRATTGVDALSINLFCMSRMFERSLNILMDLLVSAVFPESEIAIYKQNSIQKIRIAMQQNETIANKFLSRSMFGSHAYGQTIEGEDIAQINRGHLLQHYALLGAHNLSAFLSGQVQDRHLRLLEDALTQLNEGKLAREYGPPAVPSPNIQHIHGPQKFQAAIRLGRQIPSRRHPDFAALFLLNAVLGGFFGSRLMKNIREEKGLTYGIYSSLETLVHGACLIISTEAAVNKTDRVLNEIHHEIKRLQDDIVSPDELDMVRNYLMGTLLMQLDGPLRSMDMIKTMIMESLDEQYFLEFVQSIKSTTSEEVRRAAQSYLRTEDLHMVIVRQM